MKKAMIITIGTGFGVDNGVAFSVRQQNPDLLCFIYSKESEKTLEAVLTKLSKKREDVLLKQFDEINDVEILYQEYSKYIDQILRKGYLPNEVVADYTSGTKSMSSALVSSAIAKEVGVLSYVYGLRDEQGRVISDTERLSPLSPNAIFTEQKIKLFKQLFNRYQFDSAFELLHNTTIHYNFRDLTNFYLGLSKAYAEWDIFNFKQASEQLNSINAEVATQLQLKKLVENHKAKLHKLKQANEQGKLSEDDLTDLFSNAIRRFEEGKYDDCVARLYRLVEMVSQIEFEKEFQMTTDKVKIDILPDSLKERFVANQQIELGLLDTFKVLNEKSENKRTKTFFAKFDDFKKLLSVRNHSRLAHGQRPITKETCDKLISFIQEVFEIKDRTDFPKLK
ncbi:MAG TPA: TIGR02710 family CRISPR-associated CARF protein [Chitinophagales bacterium]|nr:TIGR02710 family CRISPR-associated CARF protein [Chitinophagales bacterium]